MPNWCENVLIVEGSQVECERFKTTVENDIDILDFEKILPTPPELLDSGDGWYHWRVEHWGTKWNACDTHLISQDELLTYTFNTAWAPPTPVVIEMSRKFPTVVFGLAWDEPGCDFGGYAIYGNGEEISGHTGNSHSPPPPWGLELEWALEAGVEIPMNQDAL